MTTRKNQKSTIEERIASLKKRKPRVHPALSNAGAKRLTKAQPAHWRIPVSISWDVGTLETIEAERSKGGRAMDRSEYVIACVEHALGLRRRYDLFPRDTQ